MPEEKISVLLHGSSNEDLKAHVMVKKVGFVCECIAKDGDGPELFVGTEKFVGLEEIAAFLEDWHSGLPEAAQERVDNN